MAICQGRTELVAVGANHSIVSIYDRRGSTDIPVVKLANSQLSFQILFYVSKLNILDDKSWTTIEADTLGALIIQNSEDYICRPYQAHATHVAFDYYGTECIVNQVCFKKIGISTNSNPLIFNSFNLYLNGKNLLIFHKFIFLRATARSTSTN